MCRSILFALRYRLFYCTLLLSHPFSMNGLPVKPGWLYLGHFARYKNVNRVYASFKKIFKEEDKSLTCSDTQYTVPELLKTSKKCGVILLKSIKIRRNSRRPNVSSDVKVKAPLKRSSCSISYNALRGHSITCR